MNARERKLEELLAFALDNMKFVVPIAGEDSEYDWCTSCNNPEYNHSAGCEGVAWKKEVIRILKGE